MKLSIIVPIYNVEKYLERCVVSLINQDISLSDYEIILVNDGSTDNSLSVAYAIQKKYEIVKVLSQENQGLSGARNTGLDNAKGEYLMFIDSDDYLKPNCLGALLTKCKKHDLDVCHYKLAVMKPDGKIVDDTFVGLEFDKIYNGLQIIKDGQLIGSVCSNIYKRSIFETNKLRFTLGITHEDVEFTPRLFANVNKVMVVDAAPYVYFYNDNSLSTAPSFEKRKRYLCDTVIVVNNTRIFAKSLSDKELKQTLIERCNSSIIGSLWQMLNDKDIPVEIVDSFLNLAKQFGEYPVKGRTASWRTNFIKNLFNQRCLYIKLIKITRSCH